MTKYLLTIIGHIESEQMCKDLALALTPIVDSPNLKFQHSKGVLLFHFATEVSKEELYDYILGVFFGVTETFILTELNDNMTVSLPKDIKEHLLDLENVSNDVVMKMDMRDIKNNTDWNFDEEDDDDFVALLLGQRDSIIKKPSLDQILDKIASKGLESLTQFEKDTLELYSKN